ncbi:uncharacterized protein LOC128216851 [Mya arenaria]|uniref:uncharacterized protein LOC128216851 n=1 Tax=Mya arenaria TaxID=6604 RepID=UPI0022E1F5B2|nr:uncharacterized protein LOC128216851 [Mya arenaria]
MSREEQFIYFGQCKISTFSSDFASSGQLDPCNCSSYYQLTNGPTPTKERHVCDPSLFWNHESSECTAGDLVIKLGLCDPAVPWNRCANINEVGSLVIKNDCVRKGFYSPAPLPDQTAAYISPHTLPNHVQMANLQLAGLSLLAGVIITTLLTAVLLTFCAKHLRRILVPPPRYEHRNSQGDENQHSYDDIAENEMVATQSHPASQASRPPIKPPPKPLKPAGPHTASPHGRW